ncbi:MAG TPA: radical SAM family heme chaperone HemW [Polyangiaceae bacterium]|nr:radical SAM family heme chaperone HemW [Polyangiaceae bacterium]
MAPKSNMSLEQPLPSPEPGEARSLDTLGIYVHFPWCLQKCPYCDFLSIARDRPNIPRLEYTRAVLAELAVRAPRIAGRKLASVFFGGGTPSLWGAREIGSIVEQLPRYFNFAETQLEITVECNPSSFDVVLGRELRLAGVNRVSIGVQSLNAERLKFLGRLHDAEGGLNAVRAALEAEIPRVSADLIFGVAGQPPEDAAREAATVAALGVHHVSAYALTIEPGTQFGALHRRGRLPLLGESDVAQSFTLVDEALTAHGLEHYEISNYAKPAEQARHNLGYWEGRDYLGLGCGAWGTLSDASRHWRYRNTPVPERYMSERDWPEPDANTTGGGQPFHSYETLSAKDRLLERLLLGLRLAKGVNLAQLERDFGQLLWQDGRQRRCESLQAKGKLRREGDRLWIPRSEWLFADGIIRDLV